ncbi:MAG: hypothetical protein ACRCWO_02745 [Bosea sp. (in: a-proteobacteria)]
MRWTIMLLPLAIGLALGGCNATSSDGGATTPVASSSGASRVAARSASFPNDALVGRWGIASYRQEKDRPRTQAMARSQCSNPYVITKGASDGVMMHVADDAKLYELTLKGSADGKTYLGFDAPPGDLQDREILSFSNDLITMRFVDPDANTRYGTFIYVRCGARA